MHNLACTRVKVYAMTSTDLYGGALTAALPAGWIDASDLRPVPDNQEVRDTACTAARPQRDG